MGLALTMWLAIGQNIEKPYRSFLDTNVADCNVTLAIENIPTDP